MIPAYNEEETIEELVLRSSEFGDICVINDGSHDRTGEILNKYREDIHIINHEQNTHLPRVLLDAMSYAIKNSYDYAITIDAGLSHDPNEIPNFIKHPHCDLIIGSRVELINTPLYRRFLSITGNFAYNGCLDVPRSLIRRPKYHDLTSGYRRYSNRAMQLILSKQLKSKTIEVFLETASMIHREGLSIEEIAIKYTYSNTYFKPSVIRDCMSMCLQLITNPHPKNDSQ